MCGINGYIGFENTGKGRDAILRMNEAMKHRGPDDQSHFVNDNVALGHVRLSIIDLSSVANQPMQDATGRFTIIFNGEIYNYTELKQELPDVAFKTNSDTEVLLYQYIRYGKSCLEKLRGMFALAIWDDERKELFLARDRFGKKPLYYYQDAGCFIFASEIRSLLASGIIPKKLNHGAVREFVRYQTVLGPQTLLQDVFLLEAGTSAVFANGELDRIPFWKLPLPLHKKPGDRKYIQKNVFDLFRQSVADRLVADVEVGAFLSGGIDSGAVVAMMSQVTSKTLNTFTVTFDEPQFSEARYAEIIADRYKTNHHDIVLNPEDMLHALPDALTAMDHPGGDGPNTFMVSKATRAKGIKVVLTGLGGDELFAGYPVFKNAIDLNRRKMLASGPLFMRRGISALLRLKGNSVQNQKIRELLNAPGPLWPNFYALSRSLFPSDFLNDLVLNRNVTNAVWEYASYVFDTSFDKSGLINYISNCELQTYLQHVLLRDTDQMTMAHGLEARAPFLDHRLVEYVVGLPDKEKIPVTPKQLFVESMGDLLPDEIVNRPKMGFTFPWEVWMKNELRDFCGARISNLCSRGLFNETLLRGLWERFLRGDKTVNWARVWIFVVLEDWLERNGVD